jgi:acyl-CoA thioesterase-2
VSAPMDRLRPAAVTLEQLLELLALEPQPGAPDAGLFLGPPQQHPADRVFGGLQLAQAVVAAGRTVPAEHGALSLQADFVAGVPTSGLLR